MPYKYYLKFHSYMHHFNALNATIIHSIQLLFLDLNNKLFGDLKKNRTCIIHAFCCFAEKKSHHHTVEHSETWRETGKVGKMHSIW